MPDPSQYRWKQESIDFAGERIEVHLPNIVSIEQLEKFKAFANWKQTLIKNLARQKEDPQHAFHEHPYSLKLIEVQSVDWFGPNIGFVKLKATIERHKDGERQELPGISFLRGGSVAILMILRPRDSRDERYVVLTEQPRLPVGSLQFLEIPAGMLDEDSNFKNKAVAEALEETGLKISKEELIDMTALALKDSAHAETLKPAMYPSPGGCDEYIGLILWEKELDRQEIEDLKGKLTGEKRQNEMIRLHVRDYEELWREGARDAKTLAAWALYEGLNRSGVLQTYKKINRGPLRNTFEKPNTFEAPALRKSKTDPRAWSEE